MDEKNKSNHGKKANRKLMLLLAVLIVAAVLIIVAVYASYSKNKRYTAALNLFDEGEYISAYEKLSTFELKYENVAALLPVYRAYFFYESNDYQNAIIKFDALNFDGKYSEIIWECSYKDAVGLLGQKRFDEAKKVFQEINVDGNCDDMILECSYGEAVRLLEDCYFDEAASAFMNINASGKYNDMIKECSYAKAVSFFEQERFDDALKTFETIADYKDSKQIVLECRLQNALLLMADEKTYESALGAFIGLVYTGYKVEDVDLNIYKIASNWLDDEQYNLLIDNLSFYERYEPTKKLLIEAYMRLGAQLTKDGYDEETSLDLYVTVYKNAGIKEARDTAAELIYQAARQQFENKDYDTAYYYFHIIKGHKDSYEMYQESLYLYGNALMNMNSYQLAANMFEELVNYKDSTEMKKEAVYQQAMDVSLWNNTKDIRSAIDLLNSIKTYKDSTQQINNAKAKINSIYEEAFSGTVWKLNGVRGEEFQLTIKTDGSAEFSFLANGKLYMRGQGSYEFYNDHILMQNGKLLRYTSTSIPLSRTETFSFEINALPDLSVNSSILSASGVTLVFLGEFTVNDKTYSYLKLSPTGRAY